MLQTRSKTSDEQDVDEGDAIASMNCYRKIVAASLVNHNTNNAYNASKQSMQTNTGEGENSPLEETC